MLGLQCTYYTFEFLAKGLQIKYDKDNNTTTQFIPFSQILTFRTDYIYDDKVSVITLMLRDSIKYSYTFKSRDQAEDIYKKLMDAF
jgi:hypothetical protein